MKSGVHGSIEAEHLDGATRPWIPFTPVSDRIHLKYFRIDPRRGELLASVRIPPGSRLAPHYLTGPLIAHTTRGSWRYSGRNWVSRAGDTVDVAAGSMHAIEGVGEDDAELFAIFSGELLFFDEDGSLTWEESWKTAMERYVEYCAEHWLSPHDLTRLGG